MYFRSHLTECHDPAEVFGIASDSSDPISLSQSECRASRTFGAEFFASRFSGEPEVFQVETVGDVRALATLVLSAR